MMMRVGVHEAKVHLSKLLRRVAAGETITIERYGKPIARLVAIDSEPQQRRPLGLLKGQWDVPDDAFSQETDEQVAKIFNT